MSTRASPFWDREALIQAVEGASSCGEALNRLGYSGNLGHYYPSLRRACERYGLKYPAKKFTAPPVRVAKTSPWVDIARIRECAQGATSQLQVLQAIGMAAAQKNYITLRRVCAEHGIALPPTRSVKPYPRKPPDYLDREVFVAAVRASGSKREVMERLGKVRCNRWLRNAAEYHRVELPVWKPDAQKHSASPKPIEDLLVENSTANSQVVKRRLIMAGLLADVCVGCGTGPEWNGKPLTLQLDHINGDSSDHRIENLRILCPNCHSQTPTFGGRRRHDSALHPWKDSNLQPFDP